MGQQKGVAIRNTQWFSKRHYEAVAYLIGKLSHTSSERVFGQRLVIREDMIDGFIRLFQADNVMFNRDIFVDAINERERKLQIENGACEYCGMMH